MQTRKSKQRLGRLMIEGIKYTQGQSRAKIICDDCNRDECVPCAYVTKQIGGGPARPNESQARAKALTMGWTYIKNKLRCPSCEAKRKVVPMKPVKAETQTPEPTKRQRIDIFTMLAECYDIDAGKYRQGDTDDTLAEVLGVRPGWVMLIREAEFGPDGGNEDMESLSLSFDKSRAAFRELLEKSEALEKELETIKASAAAEKNRWDGLAAQLSVIRKAVGPRVANRVSGQA
jgi:rubredoxin